MINADLSHRACTGPEFGEEMRDGRAPWEKPMMTRIEMRDAEVGTSTGADGLNTANS